jgi:hypothetical protein
MHYRCWQADHANVVAELEGGERGDYAAKEQKKRPFLEEEFKTILQKNLNK